MPYIGPYLIPIGYNIQYLLIIMMLYISEYYMPLYIFCILGTFVLVICHIFQNCLYIFCTVLLYVGYLFAIFSLNGAPYRCDMQVLHMFRTILGTHLVHWIH